MLWTDPFARMLTQFDRSAAFLPAADLTVSESDFVLTLDLPGVAPEDLSIEVEDNQLTVRGERKRGQHDEGSSYVYAQRPFGVFEHRIEIPKGVDPDAITSSMQHGVLSLVVPKPQRAEPRRIPIGSGREDRELESAAV